MDEARRIIANTIKPEDRLGVAVSGGADSMCLLSLLLATPFIRRESLLVINVEHGLRGEASKRDSAFVEAFAKQNGLEFLGVTADIPALCKESGRSEETEARLYRRALFERLLAEKRVDFVLTAHHRGDKTESVLMHLLRGSGTAGLIGMSARDGRLVRPLIDTPKEAILNYVRENSVPFVTDESNLDERYSRNFLRLRVIPLIEERYPLTAALEGLSAAAKTDDEFISSLLELDENITEEKNGIALSLDALKKHRALSSRYVMHALKRAGLVCDVERKHIESVMALRDKQSGRRIELPHGYTATRSYDKIVFSVEKEEPCDDEIEFCLGMTPLEGGIVEVSLDDNTIEPGRLKLDGDKVPEDAVVRFRREGDVFTPFGGKAKKLKEYFIDKKLAREKRGRIPLLCSGSKVLCVFGVEISDDVKIDEKSKNVLLLRYTED